MATAHSVYPISWPAGQHANQVNNSKGIAVGHVWTISNDLINNFRYGYVWEGVSTVGRRQCLVCDLLCVEFAGGAEPHHDRKMYRCTTSSDDFTVVKGQHTIEFGGNYRLCITILTPMPLRITMRPWASG